MGEPVSWAAAMGSAATGPDGFYRRGERPVDHFRTSVTAAPAILAEALGVVVADVDRALGTPEQLDVVDLGAGSGELLEALAARLPERVRLCGVDVAARPDGLSPRIAWRPDLPPRVTGLLLAHEYLDDVPVDVVEVADDGTPRLVLVDQTAGGERPGPVVDGADREWLRTWWPLDPAKPGARAEIGRSRDVEWSRIVGRLARGLAIAVDYDHERRTRPLYGTLVGYRLGRQVRPIPDGSCNLTAHVALDSCLAATAATGEGVVLRQREALTRLGLRARRPAGEERYVDPLGSLAALRDAGAVAELLDPAGLGDFGWLVQAVGIDLPERFRPSERPPGLPSVRRR